MEAQPTALVVSKEGCGREISELFILNFGLILFAFWLYVCVCVCARVLSTTHIWKWSKYKIYKLVNIHLLGMHQEFSNNGVKQQKQFRGTVLGQAPWGQGWLQFYFSLYTQFPAPHTEGMFYTISSLRAGSLTVALYHFPRTQQSP